MKIAGAADVFSCSNGVPSAACGDADWSRPVLEDRGDRRVGQRADLDRLRRLTAFGPGRLDAAKQPQHARAGSESLFRVRPPGHYRDDQLLGVRPNAVGVALVPLGVHSA